jgi:Sec-independent protein translocase protein TatA
MAELLFMPLALAGSPAAWAFVALLVIMIFAPRILPGLAKFAGRFMQREVRRRLGMPEPQRPLERRGEVHVDVIAPNALPARRRSRPKVEVIEAEPVPPKRQTASIWWVTGGVMALLGVLSWILFHSR